VRACARARARSSALLIVALMHRSWLAALLSDSIGGNWHGYCEHGGSHRTGANFDDDDDDDDDDDALAHNFRERHVVSARHSV